MKINTAKRVFAMLITATICITLFYLSVSAVSLDTKGSIVLHISDSKTGERLPEASFRLYFFAQAYEKSNGLEYDYVIPYDNCNMETDNLQDAYLPVHLTHFALSNNLKYTSETSDINGTVVFDNLTPGIYLIVPEKNIPDYYMPSPFVVNIPVYDKDNNVWVYDINATPKIQMYQLEDIQGTTYISVKKVWKTEKAVPESVSVSLLRDYKEVERVILNESNNWSYRWDNLSGNYSWSVVENEVPEDFKVSYEASENTVTIVNTYVSPNLDETTISPSDDDTAKTEPSSPEDTTKPEELIQTGQLNWPVPVFSIVGMLLFAAGWLLFNSVKKDEEPV
ncbi:MAG: Cna B-type domain-containing protein [Clostridia bacterium]|nr:Cna B-type domain-containing protein [Clostridia bacterium]